MLHQLKTWVFPNESQDYVSTDLRRLDAEPAELLANRPMDDPLEPLGLEMSLGSRKNVVNYMENSDLMGFNNVYWGLMMFNGV